MTTQLLSAMRGDVLWLTLNRPEVHNALNATLSATLTQALEAACGDASVRAVVLTGAGDRSFCSGADLKEHAGAMFQSQRGSNPIADVLRAIEACDKPVIARINGMTLAGGVGLVAACDLALAADHATFALPEVRVGLFPMMVAALLTAQIPQRCLQRMAYLGERIDAAEAAAFGLIDRAVAAAELDAALDGVLECLRQNSPAALAAGKAALREMRDMTKADRLRHAERLIADLGNSADAHEGRAAFAQKRKPRWAGD